MVVALKRVAAAAAGCVCVCVCPLLCPWLGCSCDCGCGFLTARRGRGGGRTLGECRSSRSSMMVLWWCVYVCRTADDDVVDTLAVGLAAWSLLLVLLPHHLLA